MLSFLEPRTLASILVAIAVFATVLTLAQPLLATDKLGKRMKKRGLGARAHPCSRAREAQRQGQPAAGAQGLHEAHGRPLQPEPVARQRQGQKPDGDGRLPRPAGRNRVSVLPAGDADRSRRGRSLLHLRRPEPRLSHDDEDGGGVRLRLPWHQGSRILHPQPDLEATGLGRPRLSRRHGPAPHLRRVRHVDRAGVPQGRSRDRVAVDSARRGVDADHRGTVLPAGSPHRLRASRGTQPASNPSSRS